MAGEITALFVSDGGEPFEKLELALESQGIKICRVSNKTEMLALLERPDSPQMIFTSTTLPDGTWADVVPLAARHFVPVIVVSRLADPDLYVDSLEHGAFDFIVPPFIREDLSHIVNCALEGSNRRVRRLSSAA